MGLVCFTLVTDQRQYLPSRTHIAVHRTSLCPNRKTMSQAQLARAIREPPGSISRHATTHSACERNAQRLFPTTCRLTLASNWYCAVLRTKESTYDTCMSARYGASQPMGASVGDVARRFRFFQRNAQTRSDAESPTSWMDRLPVLPRPPRARRVVGGWVLLTVDSHCDWRL